MNIAKMMQAAASAQKKMAKVQEELSKKEIEASSGGGRVLVKATASGEILAVKISPEVFASGDIELLEDLLLSALRQALSDGKKLSDQELGKLTAGLGIPGLPF